MVIYPFRLLEMPNLILSGAVHRLYESGLAGKERIVESQRVGPLWGEIRPFDSAVRGRRITVWLDFAMGG